MMGMALIVVMSVFTRIIQDLGSKLEMILMVIIPEISLDKLLVFQEMADI